MNAAVRNAISGRRIVPAFAQRLREGRSLEVSYVI